MTVHTFSFSGHKEQYRIHETSHDGEKHWSVQSGLNSLARDSKYKSAVLRVLARERVARALGHEYKKRPAPTGPKASPVPAPGWTRNVDAQTFKAASPRGDALTRLVKGFTERRRERKVDEHSDEAASARDAAVIKNKERFAERRYILELLEDIKHRAELERLKKAERTKWARALTRQVLGLPEDYVYTASDDESSDSDSDSDGEVSDVVFSDNDDDSDSDSNDDNDDEAANKPAANEDLQRLRKCTGIRIGDWGCSCPVCSGPGRKAITIREPGGGEILEIRASGRPACKGNLGIIGCVNVHCCGPLSQRLTQWIVDGQKWQERYTSRGVPYLVKLA